MGVGFLVSADRELRDVAVHAALGHAEADMAATSSSLLGRDQRQVDGVGDEVGVQQQALLLAAVGEVVALAGEPVLEVVRGAVNEIGVAERIDDDRRVGDRDEARGVLARTVEVLVAGIERNREDRTSLPLETDLLAGVVPDAGRAAPVQHIDHLLVQLPLRLQLLARRNLADIAIVRRPRGIVVQVDTPPAATRPGFELHRVQVGYVHRIDDVQPLGRDPAGVGRRFFGFELLGDGVRDQGVLAAVVVHGITG